MPATVEEAVVARLKAVAAVNTAVGGRVYATLDTQDADIPQIVVTKLSAEGGAFLSGVSRTLKRYSVQCDIYAATEAEGLSLGKAVRETLAPEGGSPWTDPAAGVKGAFFADSAASFTEDGYRLQSETFGVWFQPTG